MMKLEFTQNTPRKSSLATKARQRPLGSVRVSTSIDTIPKFPPLVHSKIPRMDSKYSGISGNRMAVPPPKLAQVRADIPDVRPESKTSRPTSTVIQAISPQQRLATSSASLRSPCTCNRAAELISKQEQISELLIHERKHEDLSARLEQMIEELKQNIHYKEKTIQELSEQFERQEKHYKDLYSQECVKHECTRQTLQEAEYSLQQKEALMQQLTDGYEEQILKLNTQMDTALSAERAEKQREISLRDEKLSKLKKQMAEALKGNSWERQQQLDELSKELQRVQEESELLKMRIKAIGKAASPASSSNKSACSNCDIMNKQLNSAQTVIKERDTYITELKTLCTTFEKQLGQQDSLLTQFAQSKGYKPAENFNKK